MKTILAVWHSGNKGKSSTLREFANLLVRTYPSYRAIEPLPFIIPLSGDFRVVVEIKGKIIGIESKGDPNTNLENRLIELTDIYKCDVILCTTRTRGDTVQAVHNVSSTRGFQKIWTSTYDIDGVANQNIANTLKAKHILELLNGLSII